MRVLMIAAPGAGKGTQGERIAEHFGVPHIATGDLLRDHVKNETEIGKRVKDLLDKGDLVPDEVVLEMVREAVEEAKKDSGGYVLDGIPRTMDQARSLYRLARDLDMTADVALHLKVDETELERRLLARADDQGRSDDSKDVIDNRLQQYREVTEPILGWYHERGILVSVDAQRSVDDVTRDVMTALEVLRSTIDRDGREQERRSIDLTGLGAAFGEQG